MKQQSDSRIFLRFSFIFLLLSVSVVFCLYFCYAWRALFATKFLFYPFVCSAFLGLYFTLNGDTMMQSISKFWQSFVGFLRKYLRVFSENLGDIWEKLGLFAPKSATFRWHFTYFFRTMCSTWMHCLGGCFLTTANGEEFSVRLFLQSCLSYHWLNEC